MAPIQIGDIHFSSVKAAITYVRKRIENIGINYCITDAEDIAFLKILLLCHPHAADKIGCGVRSFQIVPNARYSSSLQLNVIRVDGSIIDVSWRKCCSRKTSTVQQKLKKSMRVAVQPSIDDYRRTHRMCCSQCGTTNAEMHVDHCGSLEFNTLVYNFLAQNGSHPKEFIDDPVSCLYTFKKEDYEFAEKWRQYHDEHAALQILCRSCNLSKPKQKCAMTQNPQLF